MKDPRFSQSRFASDRVTVPHIIILQRYRTVMTPTEYAAVEFQKCLIYV